MPPARRTTKPKDEAAGNSPGAVDPKAPDHVTEDNVVEGSKIEALGADELAGPRSVQSKEIRPDEKAAA